MGDDTDDSNLPVKRDEERIERLKEVNEALQQGEADEILVPIEAHDIGDVDVDENPRACDLGYADFEAAVSANIGGTDRIMYDEENGDARIDCDADTFIENVEDWA